MANDRSRKLKKGDEKNGGGKRNLTSGTCKPNASLLGKTTNNGKERNDAATKTPSTNVSNAGSCYAKCGSKAFNQDASKASKETTKSITKPDSQESGGAALASATTTNSDVCEPKPLKVMNPFIEKMEEDILYHIALGNKSHDLPKMFGDIKFVVMGGTPKRMEQFAYYIADQIGYELPAGTLLNDISKNSHRYAMYKVGPILSISHGMGMPSIGILLHELIKLVSHAGVKDPTFIRIGTCGGFNKKAGTVVVSNKVVNDFMESFLELPILGKKVRFSANLNQTIVKEILEHASADDKFETIAGVTYCTDNFYEGSGRADGAFCEFSEQEGLNYYQELQRNGVVNVEMESLAFAVLTCRAGIKSAVITVILSDRLQTDQIKQPKEVLDEWQTRPQKLLAKYIKKKLMISGTAGVGQTTELPASNTLTPSSFTACKTCKGTGSEATTESSIGTKPSANDPPSVCKPCSGVSSKIESDSTTTVQTTARSSNATPSTACKSCTGSGTTVKPNDDTVLKSTTADVPSVCKPCNWFPSKNNGTTSQPAIGTTIPTCTTGASTGASTTTKSSNGNLSSVCKPCVGFSSKNNGTASQPATGITMPTSTTGTSTTSKSSNNNSSSVCKPCTGFSSKSTTETTAGKTWAQPSTGTNASTTPSKPSNGIPSVCEPCVGFPSKSATDTTTGKATTCPSNGTPSSTAIPTPTKGGSVSSKSSNGNISVCKPCVGFSMKSTTEPSTGKTSARSSTDTPPSTAIPTSVTGVSTDSSTASTKPSVCKPCLGSTTKLATEFTTSKPSVTTPTSSSTFCKKYLGTSAGAGVGAGIDVNTASKSTNGTTPVCKPCIGTSAKPANGATTAKTSSMQSTTKSTSEGASVCKPCMGSTPVATQPSGTPAASICKNGTGTTVRTSTATSETSIKSPSPNENQTTERKRSRCVPMKCYTKGKDDDDETPASTATPKTYVAKDFDSSSKSTISNDSWRSCYQKCSKGPLSTGPSSMAPETSAATTNKPQTFHTPEQDKVKGVAASDKLGPCCAPQSSPKKVTDDKGSCCTAKSNSNSSSSDECSGGQLDSEECEFKESVSKTDGASTKTPRMSTEFKGVDNANQLGPCCTGERRKVTIRSVDSNKLGPLCTEKSKNDSLDESCDDKTNKSEPTGTSKPTPGNIEGCPITIRTPCNYSADNASSSDVQSQTTPSLKLDVTSTTSMPQSETPKPSPDTPDTSTMRAMPAFVTPTPPHSKTSICCSKFSNNGTALTASVNKEANKYDESPSPCAACKKYQESKNRSSGSTPSDSQPEIIKCPRKLKRLKEECQGYD